MNLSDWEHRELKTLRASGLFPRPVGPGLESVVVKNAMLVECTSALVAALECLGNIVEDLSMVVVILAQILGCKHPDVCPRAGHHETVLGADIAYYHQDKLIMAQTQRSSLSCLYAVVDLIYRLFVNLVLSAHMSLCAMMQIQPCCPDAVALVDHRWDPDD